MVIQKNDIKIIASEHLSRYPDIVCGISTRNGCVETKLYDFNMSYFVGDSEQNVKMNRKHFLDELGITIEQLAIPKQVHSDVVIKIDKPGEYESCDALITNKQNIFLTVIVADCVPIFIYDPNTKSIAAVHAGWRGSISKVVEKTIRLMETSFKVKVNDLIAFIGPSAGVCCYEVGKEVAEKFESKYLTKKLDKRIFLDLKLFNKDLLIKCGVNENNIETCNLCTICNPTIFHSYRRDGKHSGRMMGIIGRREHAG